jgi:hypothetical protein
MARWFQVIDDSARFGQRLVTVGTYRRSAQRMHPAQRRWREHGFTVPLITLDRVFQSQLFQQPEDALSARVVEVVNSDHAMPVIQV